MLLNVVKEWYLNDFVYTWAATGEWKTSVDAGNNPDSFLLECVLLNLELFWVVASEASVYSPEMCP